MSEMPAGSLSRQQFIARVAENVPLCREHYRLVLALPWFPPTQPGQFIQIACRTVDELGRDPLALADARQRTCPDALPTSDLPAAEFTAPVAFLRRPFSLAGRRDHHDGGGTGGASTTGRADAVVQLEIIHRVVGVGTDWLAKRKPGDPVSILGPLGNRFTLPSTGQTALLVGGGVGIPPMLYLAEALGRQGIRAIAFCGALTRDLLPLTIDDSRAASAPDPVAPAPIIREFAQHGIDSVISTDDGSLGFRGYITQALEHWLDVSHRSSPLGPRPSPLLIYSCGPEPMMKRIADIAIARRIECQVAVERAMACGMGTCQSCCIRVRKPDPAQPPLAGKDWCWRLACTDGPIFRAAELLW